MKITTLAALPLTLALCATATPAVSAAGTQEIIVTGSPREVALADWSQRVRLDLESKMAPPRSLTGAFDEGLVKVRFVCSRDGKPERVAILQSSGSNSLDHAALRTVRRLSSLHPMVEGMRPNQQIVAQMLYINSYTPRRTVARRIKEAEDQAQSSNKWFTREQIASGEVLMLGVAY
jgi:TonB family protein